MPELVATEGLTENSWHDAKVIEISEFNGDGWSKLNWKFQVVGGDNNGTIVMGNTPTNLVVGDRLHSWMEALLNIAIPPGKGVNTDNAIGQFCRIQIGYRPNQKNPGSPWKEVSQIVPITESAKQDKPPF